MDRLEILRMARQRAQKEVSDGALSDVHLATLRKEGRTDEQIIEYLAAEFCEDAAFNIRDAYGTEYGA